MPRRSSNEQKIDILRVLASRKRTRPTRLMGFANLDHQHMLPLLDILEKNGLISVERTTKRHKWITITTKGESLIRDFDDVFKRLT